MAAEIAEAVGRLSAEPEVSSQTLRLMRANRIRTIQGSLAIEGNTLSEAQITAILEGRRVLAPPREVQEVRNALAVYDHLDQWQASDESALLEAHRMMMAGLLEDERLLAVLDGEMAREALQIALGLQDRKSFRARYLVPTLEEGWIEMTLPDRPNSRLQRYRRTRNGDRWAAGRGDV